MDAIEKVSMKLLKNYRTNETEIMFGAEFDLTKGTTISQPRKNGHRLVSGDRAELIIVQADRYVVGQLAPYPGWDAFIVRAKRDFAILKNEFGHRAAKRIGVRFINRIDVPRRLFPIFNPSDFTNLVPTSPPFGKPQLISYTLQMQNELEHDNCKAQLTTTKIASPVPDMDGILLDIDVFCDVAVPESEVEMWALVGRMRNYKNDVFEACITNAARSLFE